MKHIILAMLSLLIVFVIVVPTNRSGMGDQMFVSSDTIRIFLPFVLKKYDYTLYNKIYIPAGTFQMGCDPEHNDGYYCFGDQTPLHIVYLDAYFIDKTEVTNAMYSLCEATGVCAAPASASSWTRPDYYNNQEYSNYPVINIDWDRANDYCIWAGGSLPTEAQWEKAARGNSDTRAFPWGDQNPDCTLANFEDYDGIHDMCVGDTSIVGSYPLGSSPYGLLDVAGNVWEWVADWYSPTYYATSPDTNPTGPETGSLKILRGGCYTYREEGLRVAFRLSNSPTDTSYAIGFRCVVLPDK